MATASKHGGLDVDGRALTLRAGRAHGRLGPGLPVPPATRPRPMTWPVAATPPPAKTPKGAHLRGDPGSSPAHLCVAARHCGAQNQRAPEPTHDQTGLPDLPHPPLPAGACPPKWFGAGRPRANATPMASTSCTRTRKATSPTSRARASSPWLKTLKPEYAWFNGTVNYTLLSDKIRKNRRAHPHQQARRQSDRRQIHDLADEGDARHPAV